MATGSDEASCLYSEALRTAYRTLVHDIITDDLLDCFIQQKFLPKNAIQDIKVLAIFNLVAV